MILKNNERLLSFEEPVHFIFSHSSLREGWDQPKMLENPLNDRFEKAEFHKIWNNNQPQVCITASGIHTRVLERRHRIFAEQKSCLYPMRLPGLLLWGGYTSKFA